MVHDNAGVAEVTVDGNIVPTNENGIFEYRTLSLPTASVLEF